MSDVCTRVEYIKLGFPGMLSLCLEWWAFEAISVFCGWVEDADTVIGANAVMLNISAMTYVIYLGISAAASIRVGTALGAGDYFKAQTASNVGLVSAFISSSLFAIVFLILRKQMPKFFVKDADIRNEVTRTIAMLSTYQIVDAVNIVVAGIFKGAGHQSRSAKINFVAFYTLGLPLAAFLTFGISTDMADLISLWIGLVVALTFACLSSLAMLYRWEWKSMAAAVSAEQANSYRRLEG
mmetsp:Transcript_10127/g.12178  ORF Transcript_10127/g.12178 Transcript_10127/m.12178 type:complete len:239 (+) Transcript_10127:209-925(+)